MEILEQVQGKRTKITVSKEGDRLFLKFGDGTEIQSMVDLKNPLLPPLTDHYWNYIALFPLINPDLKSILILGFGAGTIPRLLNFYYPTLEIDSVEIDQEVIDIVKRHFPIGKMNIIHDDATHYLRVSPKSYDLIVLDAFEEGDFDESLLTDEFFHALKSRLKGGGIVVGNYIYRQDIAQKYKYFFVKYFKSRFRLQMPRSYNYLVWGSDMEYSAKDLPDGGELAPLVEIMRNQTKVL